MSKQYTQEQVEAALAWAIPALPNQSITELIKILRDAAPSATTSDCAAREILAAEVRRLRRIIGEQEIAITQLEDQLLDGDMDE